MKQIISISFIALSTLILLMLAVVPHHHHEGTTCIVMEFCEKDHAINDKHTKHHDDMPDKGHNKTCITETEFIVPPHNDETKCKTFSCNKYNHSHIYLFSAYFLITDFLIYDPGDSFSKIKCGEAVPFYKSAKVGQLHGLRAPPFMQS